MPIRRHQLIASASVFALAVLGLFCLGATPAAACPSDPARSDVPQDARNNICGAWDYAVSHGFNPGTPLNETHPWAEGYIRDFSGGYYGRGGIMERHGEGWAFIVGGAYWDALVRTGGAPKIGYPDGPHVFGGHLKSGPKANMYMTFTKGVINSSAHGTFASYGGIRARWDAMGNVSGPLGLPIGDEADTARIPGRFQQFEGGNLIWDRATGQTWHVYGGILNKYAQLGYSTHPLGLPASDRQYNAGKGNDYQVFQGGVINQYGGNAYETHGAILDKWNALGGANGTVGLPISDEAGTARIAGRFSRFQGGNIYYNQRLNRTVLVYGGILNKYLALGFSNHPLGLPVSDRQHNAAKGNDYQVFDGGVINQYGGNAYETHGAIFDRWSRAGGANGSLGLPTSDEGYTSRSPQGTLGRYSRFQRGVINYNPKINRAIVLFGAIGAKYAQMGYAASYLGLPITEEQDLAGGGKRQDFEGGYIMWKPRSGARNNRDLSKRPKYVIRALGDSYAAGFGLVTEGFQCALGLGPMPTSACDNPYQSWAGKTVGLLSKGPLQNRSLDYANLAVSGSDTSDWLRGADRGSVKDFRSRLASIIGSHPDLILLSLGGNDILGAPGSCQRDVQCVTHTLAFTKQRMTALLRRLVTQTSARIYVLLYPDIPGDLGVADRLNEALKKAIQSTGARVKYIPQTHFGNHDCGSGGDGSWRLKWDSLKTIDTVWAPLCIHPNFAGSMAIASRANRTIQQFGL